MKNIIIFLYSIVLIFFLVSCVSTKSSQVTDYRRLKKQIPLAVLEIKNKTKYGEKRLADSATDILIREMGRSGNFILIEREKINDILKELELQMSDITDDTNTAQIGKILNCQYLITGSISNFGVKTEGKDLIIAQQKTQKAVSEVDIKIISVETAQIIYAAYGRGVSEKTYDNFLGVGSSGSYDESLAGDSLRAALSQALEAIILYFKDQE